MLLDYVASLHSKTTYRDNTYTQHIANELPVDLLKEIEYWSKKERTDTNFFILRLIGEGLREWKIRKVLRMYQNQEITLLKAAEIADISR